MTAPTDSSAGAGTAPAKADQPDLAPSDKETLTPTSTIHAFPTPTLESRCASFNLTDLGNAKRLVARFGAELHHDPILGKWRIWDGRRWSVDRTGEIYRLAKETVRQIYAEAAGASCLKEGQAFAEHARKSESIGRLRAMVELASTEPAIPVLPDQLDVDPWLLNTLNGTVDLRTGTRAVVQPSRHLLARGIE